MELTGAIRGYVEDKIGYLGKFFSEEIDAKAFVEIGRESNHHQKGDEIFLAEVRIKIPGREFFLEERSGDLYAAIDKIKEELQREINKNKDRKQTLFVRGARKIKKRIKGMKPWWPFSR